MTKPDPHPLELDAMLTELLAAPLPELPNDAELNAMLTALLAESLPHLPV